MATPKYRREAARKLLARVLTHPRFAEGLPVRFRCDPSLTKPAIRCNRFALSVWLPLSLAPCIPLLARFVRSVRRKPMVTIVVCAKPKETPKVPTNGTPTNRTRPVAITAKPTPTNGTRPKPKARLKPKPAWQQGWKRLWDEVVTALFGGPAGAK